jgi:hypothetical protein
MRLVPTAVGGRSLRCSPIAGPATGVVVALLSLLATGARADTNPAPTSPGDAAPSDARSVFATVNVEATRRRDAIKREVSNFVSTIVVQSHDISLARWHRPICPLVAGLPRDQGEFVLRRLSQSIAAAHAPLAAQHCRANFFVILTSEPGVLLKKWRARDRRLFADHDGEGAIKRFVATSKPIRVWYNAAVSSADGEPLTDESLPLSGTSLSPAQANTQYPTNKIRTATRLQYSALRNLASVILVVDSERVKGITVGQLADYSAMAGLAEIRLDKDVGSTPSILHLFDETGGARPQGLSDFDQALLKALYTTDQRDVMQWSELETHMVQTLAP